MAKHARPSASTDLGASPNAYSRDAWQSARNSSGADAGSRHARTAEPVGSDRAPAASYAPQPESASGASYYARDNYGGSATGAHARRARKSMHPAKRAGLIVLAVIGVLAIAAGAYALWFSNALDRALAPSAESKALMDDLLVDVPSGQPFYTLVLGSDSREGSEEAGYEGEAGEHERSDVIMLVRIDPQSKTVTMVSIPRDTPYVTDDGTVVKINETYDFGGAAGTVKAVSQLTGVPISHYAEVRLSEFEAIIDTIGGVEVYVDRELAVHDSITFERITLEPGLQTLDGKQAQAFVRARHAYEDEAEGEEYHRQSNVRTLLSAVIKKVLAQPVPQLPGTILELARYVTTDMNTGNLVSLALGFAGGDITMYSCTGPTAGDYAEQYNGMWLCYPNPEGWAQLMREVDTGEEPGDIDYAATQLSFDDLR